LKLSELIVDAERTLKEFGDIPVVIRDVGCGCCSSGHEFAGTHVEKEAISIWDGHEYRKVPTVYVVS
jgi:hypothetical protein